MAADRRTDGRTAEIAARALLAMRDICLNSDDASLKPLGKQSLIPRAVAEQK